MSEIHWLWITFCQSNLSDPVKGPFVMLPACKWKILCFEGRCCAAFNFQMVKYALFAFVVPDVTKVTRVIESKPTLTKVTRVIESKPTITKVTRVIEGAPAITKVTRVVSGIFFYVILTQYISSISLTIKSSWMLSSTGPQYSVSTGNLDIEGLWNLIWFN